MGRTILLDPLDWGPAKGSIPKEPTGSALWTSSRFV